MDGPDTDLVASRPDLSRPRVGSSTELRVVLPALDAVDRSIPRLRFVALPGVPFVHRRASRFETRSKRLAAEERT